MDSKPKVSPNDTYIFDDEDLDQLEDFSISTILDESDLADAALDDAALDDEEETVDGLQALDDTGIGATAADLVDREPTIDELLEGADLRSAAHTETQADLDTADTGTYAALEVLLDPELIFPKRSGGTSD